jgi:BASS family bile acid:Na+ symporter
MTDEVAIRLLTSLSLAALLFGVGLRLDVAHVLEPLRMGWRLWWIAVANFVFVPVLASGLILAFEVPLAPAVAILLLAASPFAPVVPVFARLTRSDLGIAAGLTAFFPFLSAFLTPLVCGLMLRALPGAGELHFSVWTVLAALMITITLPLLAGVAARRLWPTRSRMLIRPIDTVGEIAGALSLAFVTFVEIESVVATGWRPLLTMGVLSEISLLMGYALAGGGAARRQVIALGTGNRNIALAILVALSLPGSQVVAGVVACGLLLIFQGLAHVAWWRFRPNASV